MDLNLKKMKNLKIGTKLYQDHKRKIPLNDGFYVNFDTSFTVVKGKVSEIKTASK